jgi:DNA modification methylase
MTITERRANRIEQWPVERLRPYERNAKIHSPAQIGQIAESIKRFGFNNPILVDSADGIIAGHGRFAGAQKLGLREVPVIVLDHLSDAERRAYIIADNRIAENAAWDTDMLTAELAALNDEEFDLGLLGFTDRELEQMLAVDDGGRADECPDVPDAAVTRTGDLWLLGRHRVLCGDATNAADVARLMGGHREDAIVTDPPYGVGVDYASFEDSRENVAQLIAKITERILSAPCAVLTPGIPSMWLYPQPVWLLAWIHPAPNGGCPWGFAGVNPILAYGKDPYLAAGLGRRPDSIVAASDREGVDGHPTPKPIKVWQWLVDRVAPNTGSTILDLFGGSGTTLMACEVLRHNARLIEIEPRYCDVIVTRWQEYTSQAATLEGDGRTFAAISAERRNEA